MCSWMLPKRLLIVLKKQQCYYSSKEKRHTFKTQLLIEPHSRVILSTALVPGRVYDKALLDQRLLRVHPDTAYSVHRCLVHHI